MQVMHAKYCKDNLDEVCEEAMLTSTAFYRPDALSDYCSWCGHHKDEHVGEGVMPNVRKGSV